MLESAKWIAAPQSEKDETSPLLRTSFVLSGAAANARLCVCALGYGVVAVNGRPLTNDVLTTPVSKYDATCYDQTYEVTDRLVPGENVIGVMLGNGWYNDVSDTWDYEKAPWRHHPKLILELAVTCQNGETLRVTSGSGWKTIAGPVLYNHARCGERYDAGKLPDGWDCPGFDDGGWESAFVCRGPGGLLKTTELPPIRIMKTLPAVEIYPGVYDVGENTSGWARIRVKSEAGRKIVLRFAERLTPDGQLETKQNSRFNHFELSHTDEYICRGGDWEEWEPHFCYHGFRYIQAENAPAEFELEGRVAHTDLPEIGHFSCSDEMLNRIHAAARRSTLTNFHSIPTDCPHREQNGWTGDALLSSEQALVNFDMVEAYRKWLADFRDVQRPNGQLPGIVPTGGWGFNWGSGPAWDSALILIPLYVRRYAKDDRLIRENWEAMNRYLRFLNSMAEDCIVNFGLGDWCAPTGAAVCPAALTDTAYYYADACAMAECAAILGENPAPYRELAASVRRAFRGRFLREGLPVEESQTALACVLFQGLLEESERPAAAARLAQLVEENGFHIGSGILGTKYIFRALSDHGFADVLYKMVTNPTYPSYAHWINSGMTTLCEDWEMIFSLNHHMYSEVDLWFYRTLAGIRLDEAELVIAPCFLPGLEWVKASHRDIRVEWNREKITVTVPRSAVLIQKGERIPLSAGTSVFPVSADNR